MSGESGSHEPRGRPWNEDIAGEIGIRGGEGSWNEEVSGVRLGPWNEEGQRTEEVSGERRDLEARRRPGSEEATRKQGIRAGRDHEPRRFQGRGGIRGGEVSEEGRCQGRVGIMRARRFQGRGGIMERRGIREMGDHEPQGPEERRNSRRRQPDNDG